EGHHPGREQRHEQREPEPSWREQEPVHVKARYSGRMRGYEMPDRAVLRDGGVNPFTGSPARPRRSTSATVLIGFQALPSPARWNGLSGSAMKLAAASCGVNPTNQAARVSSVVPVLPPTGRPTCRYTPGAVDQLPQDPRAARSPVTHRLASTTPRATCSDITCSHFLSAAATGLPSASVIDSTGEASQYSPSAAKVAYALAISSGVV